MGDIFIFLAPQDTGKQADKQIRDRWKERQVNRQIDEQMNKNRRKQMTKRQADSRADWQGSAQAGRFLAERYWLEEVAGRETGRWTDSHARRQQDWRNTRDRKAERLPDSRAPSVENMQLVKEGDTGTAGASGIKEKRDRKRQKLSKREGQGRGQCTAGWLTVDLWH